MLQLKACLSCSFGSKVDVSIGNTEFMLLMLSLLMNSLDEAKRKYEGSRGVLRLLVLVFLPTLSTERAK